MKSVDPSPVARRLRPYVVSADAELLRQAEAMGYIVQHAFSASGEAWFEALRALDRLVFQSSAMVLPGWVFFDCALAPGFVVGLADDLRAPSSGDEAPSPSGPRPVSLAIAIPTADPEIQLVHSLGVAPHGTSEALKTTWDLLVELVAWSPKSGGVLATAGWGTQAEELYARHAPIALLAAYMPAHDQPMTATLGLGPRFSSVPPEAVARVLACDADGLRALQSELDAGASAWVLGALAPGSDGTPVRRIAVLAGPMEAR